MDSEPGSGESRGAEIRQRISAIDTRLEELQAIRGGDVSAAAFSERIAAAQRHLTAAQAAAQQAMAASIRAFGRAAEAHERVAVEHERVAATGSGDKDEHEQLAVVHRAAAAADMQSAEQAQAQLREEQASRVSIPR